MNMILQKFFIFAFIWHFTATAPADVIEVVDISEREISTESTSTLLPDISTVVFDSEQNEVDTKFNEVDVKTTTMSDIDSKIESIEAESQERTSEKSSEEEISTQGTSMMINEPETTTPQLSNSEVFEIEKNSHSEETTECREITQASEELEAEVEEIQEPTENKNLERTAKESDERTETTTTESLSTTLQISTEVPLQESSVSDLMNATQISEVEARTKLLIEIRKMLRAHLLRKALTMLNEAKKRQLFQTPEQHATESRIVEEIVPAFSGSECECDEQADVSSKDEDKVIAYDKNLHRYVYMDKMEYEQKYVSIVKLKLI